MLQPRAQSDIVFNNIVFARMEAVFMAIVRFPVIDPVATGANITRLRQARGLTVRDLQQFFGFEEPQAIYKWQRGQSLPSIDNLYALSELFQISMNEILVSTSPIHSVEQQGSPCCSNFLPRYRLVVCCLYHNPKTFACH